LPTNFNWIFCFAFHIITNGQTKSRENSVDIEIYGGQNGNLYTDGSNLISIVTKDTATTFTIKSSKGKVWKLDKYMFFVENLQKGKTTIAIFKTESGKDFLVKKKDYNVLVPKLVKKYNSLSTSPNISLGGFTNGKVKLDNLKRITSLSINENYTILQATFFVGNTDLAVSLIRSKYFDNHLKELWK